MHIKACLQLSISRHWIKNGVDSDNVEVKVPKLARSFKMEWERLEVHWCSIKTYSVDWHANNGDEGGTAPHREEKIADQLSLSFWKYEPPLDALKRETMADKSTLKWTSDVMWNMEIFLGEVKDNSDYYARWTLELLTWDNPRGKYGALVGCEVGFGGLARWRYHLGIEICQACIARRNCRKKRKRYCRRGLVMDPIVIT